MKRTLFLISLLTLALLLGLGVTKQLAQRQFDSSLLRPTDRQGTVRPEDDPTIIRRQNVVVDLDQLRNGGRQKLVLPLFDGDSLNLIRTRQEQVRRNGSIWYGKVENEPASSVIFSVVGEVVVGEIMRMKGKSYQIRYIGDGVHSLREIDRSKFPDEEEPLKPKLSPTGQGEDVCSTDPPTEIDVMVVYTPDARAASGSGPTAGSTEAMEAEIYLAVAQANEVYLNSNITQRLRLVHTEEVAYTETGSTITDLNAVTNGSDGIIDNVQTLRNTFAADVVVLIVKRNDNGKCGRAWNMETVSHAFESSAYAVVKQSCASGQFSFVHEVGHVMGALHDWANDSTDNRPYHYNHGYGVTSPSTPGVAAFRTVMAYSGSCGGCLRIPFFSNPNVNVPGTTTEWVGTSAEPQPTDNHQVLNNTAATVANFRCSSPAANNVWMKDTWNDTGVEPDPNTASEDMWKSPYIWVRNTQDTSLLHQHEHQNPQHGSPNWVYVKLHNGGDASASGTLELYWAHAATGLSWQTDWTLLASIPVSGFTAHSTKIVEQQWNSLPGTGHYCMVARWVSAADPMTTPETMDINHNVRGNNNLVWRNLEIVDMAGDESDDESFIVRNVEQGRSATTLLIRPPAKELQNSFLQYGEVRVKLDGTLMKAWRRGGAMACGVEFDGSYLFITDPNGARLSNLLLEPGATGRVKIRFRKLPTTPRRQFIVDAVQLAQRNVIGGVSFEIHTDWRQGIAKR
ncbi:MAG: hypothetical protein QOH25_2361 [Acidobacteriota bacterium]|jgi:hypothetical protein|nr:hypothetical protein [Acidobacteriota bacterium]